MAFAGFAIAASVAYAAQQYVRSLGTPPASPPPDVHDSRGEASLSMPGGEVGAPAGSRVKVSHREAVCALFRREGSTTPYSKPTPAMNRMGSHASAESRAAGPAGAPETDE